MTLTSLIAWLSAAVTFGTIIMFGSVGEILTEKSGNLNLGVPGIMYLGAIGALAGAFFYETGTADPIPAVSAIIAIACSIAASCFGGLIYSFLTITLRANQNVTGLTLTIFGGGVANFFGGSLVKLSGGVGQISVAAASAGVRVQIPWLSTALGPVSSLFFSYGIFAYVAVIIALIVQHFLTRTRHGLNLRAVGENPATADAAGISVTKYKYCATIVGAAIEGLGGMYYVLDYIKGGWDTGGSLEALGWLAVALVIFTSWRPKNAIWGAYLFGFCYWIYLYIPSAISAKLAGWFGASSITYMQNLYQMIPYIVTIIVLIIVSTKKKRENQNPASLGISYFREER
jgi:simple sugar transport system permease protein